MLNKTAQKIQQEAFAKCDPRTHFIVTLTDRNLDPANVMEAIGAYPAGIIDIEELYVPGGAAGWAGWERYLVSNQ